MNLLLDTHILLWAAAGTLPEEGRDLIEDTANTLYFSPVSIWEVVIKSGLGRTDFRVDPVALHQGLLSNGYVEAPLTTRSTLAVRLLPPIHKDPFDRLLIAQAATEGLILVTADSTVARYPGSIRYVR